LCPRYKSVVPGKHPARFVPLTHVMMPGTTLPPSGKLVVVGTMVPPEPSQLMGKGLMAGVVPPLRRVLHKAPGPFGPGR
jgi:hypothetical protein